MGEKVHQKTLYDLFPHDPSNQGGRIAGLPELREKECRNSALGASILFGSLRYR
jgi:hypothetical protein